MPADARAEPLPITGRVADESGRPIVGASVTIRALLPPYEEALAAFASEEPEPLVATLTDDHGEYRLDAPRIGPYQFRIDAPGRVVVQLDLLPLLEAQRLPTMTPPLDAGLEVRVVDADGSGVAGARVELLGQLLTDAPELWMLRSSASTDETGHARVPGPANRSTTTVRAYVPVGDSWLPLAAQRVESGRATFRVPEGADGAAAPDGAPSGLEPTVLEIPPPPSTVLGRVVDGRGTPLAGALVWIAQRPSAHVYTGSDGVFVLERPGTDGFGVAHPDFLPRRLDPVPPGDEIPDLALSPGFDLRARVVDAEGRGVAGASVVVLQQRPQAGQALAVRGLTRRARETDAEGRIVLHHLVPGGDYLVELQAPGSTSRSVRYTVPPAVSLDVPADVSGSDGEAPEVTWTLGTGRRIAGRVIDSGGAPIHGASVTGASLFRPREDEPTTITDEEGRFTLEGLPEDARIVTTADGFVERQWLLPPASEAAGYGAGRGANDETIDLGDLALERGGELAGRVVDADGRGVGNALVSGHVLPEEHSGAAVSFRAQSSADGRFALEGLPARGRLELSVFAHGHGPVEQPIDLPADEPVEIRLEASTRLSGHVVGPDGQPLGGVSVRVTQPGPHGSTSSSGISSDAAGEFVFERARPGRVILDASTDELYLEEPVEIDLAPGERIEDFELRLVAGGALEGTVLDADGVGTAGVTIRVRHTIERAPLDSPHTTVTDGVGRFRLGGLPSGPALLVARADDGREVRREIEIQPGVREIEIDLPHGLRFAGTVVDPTGRPLPGVVIGAIDLASETPSFLGRPARSDEMGRFVLETPGPVSLLCLGGPNTVPRFHRFAEPLTNARDDLRFELPPTATLEGRLRVPTSQLGKAQVSVLCTHPDRAADAPIDGLPHYAIAAIDAEGRFRVYGLVPCNWSVVALVGDQEIRRTVRVEPGVETVEIEMTSKE